MDGLVDREAAAKPVDRDVDAPTVASLTACATRSGERPRAWNVTTPYPASGSSPSHSGCRCVPSKRVLVLYSSYLPCKAADLVRFIRLATSACVSGLKVRTALRAWSRIPWLSMPVICTGMGRLRRYCSASMGVTVLL